MRSTSNMLLVRQPRSVRSILLSESRRKEIGLAIAAGVLVFALALFPRVQNLDQYVTVDEDLTLGRTGNFADGLATGNLWRTYQIGHPEVTVMWIAALALGSDWAREFRGTVSFYDRVETVREVADRPDFMAALVQARLGLAMVHSLLLATAALLLWRIAGPAAGVIGGALLALEPFLVAHGQVLRSDALLAELLLVAILAAAVYWLGPAGHWALLLAGLATGLALLTKTPALVLLPVVGGLALLTRRRLWAVGCWLLGAALVYLALWPALWVRPLDALKRVVQYSASRGGAPTDPGSFLLGEAMMSQGAVYYVVALALRLSPLVLIGLALLVWLRGGAARRLVGVLLVAALVYAFGMGIAPKKADRYALPIVPIVAVLAGIGVAALVRQRGALGVGLALGAIVAVQGASLRSVWPYPLAYYNPVAGGGEVASRAMLVGWGEGLDVVARTLNRQPDAPSRTAAVYYPATLSAQYVGTAVPLEAYDVADFAVLYIAADQRRLTPRPLQAALSGRQPEFEVTLNGIRYAQVFRLDRPEFEQGIVLDDISLSDRFVERRETAKVSLRWKAQQPLRGPVRSRVELLAPDGRVAAAVDGEPREGPRSADGLWQEQLRIRVPDRLGTYKVALSLHSVSDARPLAVLRRPPGLEDTAARLTFRSLSLRVH
jgi:hypothetical protein